MAEDLVIDVARRLPGGLVVRAALGVAGGSAPVTVLFGPSGAGKTTVLRCVAGLDRPDTGTVRFRGETWSDASTGVHVAPQQRGVGYVFQDYALFPHLTVAENVAFGLARLPAAERRARTTEALRAYRLEALAARRPRELSGGEQQRVALARAMAPRPRLLLLDEPLSALDAPTREALRAELRRRLVDAALPALVVTHDRVEALALGDRVAVIDAGRVLQVGPVDAVFNHPADVAVARIVGVETVVTARVRDVTDGLATVEAGGAALVAVAPEGVGREVVVCIRAEDVALVPEAHPATSARNALTGRVVSAAREGPLTRVTLDCGFPLVALVTRQAWVELGLTEGALATAVVKATAIKLVPHGG